MLCTVQEWPEGAEESADGGGGPIAVRRGSPMWPGQGRHETFTCMLGGPKGHVDPHTTCAEHYMRCRHALKVP